MFVLYDEKTRSCNVNDARLHSDLVYVKFLRVVCLYTGKTFEVYIPNCRAFSTRRKYFQSDL